MREAPRIYLARRRPGESGWHLVLVRSEEAPVAVRYSSRHELYRGARRILRRLEQGRPALSNVRQSNRFEGREWGARLGRRLDCLDVVRDP